MLCFYWLTSRTDVNQIILAPDRCQSHGVSFSIKAGAGRAVSQRKLMKVLSS